MKTTLSFMALMLSSCLLFSQTTLINFGSVWKYLDNGSNQGTTWKNPSFNDASWASGPAQLGYGDGDEATVVSFGSKAAKKYITTYFRKTISVSDASVFSSFTLNLKRDDGAVVYINGSEVFRSNMPTGTISYTTKASTTASDDGNTVQTVSLPAGTIITGNNVIAVEIHQRSASDPDISFDLALTGASDIVPPSVTGFSPADNATGVSNTANLVITFNENIQKGTGNILVKESGTTTQTIDVASAAVTISGNTATINPNDFTYNAAVHIEISNGAFKDLSNNNYAGLADATTWNFNIEDAPSGPQTLITYGSVWKYLDNGSNQGSAWTGTSYNDASWASGPAQLGYGDGDEATVVSYGPNSSAKYITTYFRKNIFISNPTIFTSITGNVRRDDGIVIYINGTEVYRNNLVAGAGYTTLASLASDDGNTPQPFSFSPSVLISGNNIIAVEIHQNSATSSDISFDLEMTGNTNNSALLTRGPYLNMGNETAVTLRWRTDIATNSRVEVGIVHGTYSLAFNDAAITTEHEIRITGLNSDTKYFYRFGSSTQYLQSGTDNFFVTTPPANTTRKLRFAVFGDCGRNDNGYQPQTLAAYQNFLGSNSGEIMILLGDNAYTNGTDAEYQTGFFAPYQASILKNHIIMPAPGNHDYYSTNQASRSGAYYQNFTMPTAGECGGVASGTEAFYSWNRGDVHFISLDSYGTESPNATRLYDTLGPQVTWLKQDLAANTRKWTIVYWHHPPYTMGSHNSDTESELVNIRTNLLRILERYGVDLIMCGHSHDYERSYLLKDYFGNEASFNTGTHTVSSSSAKYDGSANSCPYTVASGQVNHGTVYVVSGSSGASGGVQAGYPHNAMPWSFNDGGMLYLEIEDNRLNGKFIRRDQVIADQFTIMKDVNKTTNMTIPSATPTQLTASWIGNYSWNTGATTRSITVSPSVNTTYTVNDGTGCVGDVFNITVSGSVRRINAEVLSENGSAMGFSIIPTIVYRGQPVRVKSSDDQNTEFILLDVQGRMIRKYQSGQANIIETNDLQSGVYFIYKKNKGKTEVKKFIVIN